MIGSCSPSSVGERLRHSSASGPWRARRGRRDGRASRIAARVRGRSMRSWLDERPVEVEREQPDREARVRHDVSARVSGCAGSIRATRGRPARSGRTSQVQPGIPLGDERGTASAWSAPISRRATPSARRTRGSRSTSAGSRRARRGHRRARRAARTRRRRAARSIASVGTYGRFAPTTSSSWPSSGSRSATMNSIRSATAWADGVLARELERLRTMSVARIWTSSSILRRRSATASAIAIGPRPVPTSTTRIGRRARRPRARRAAG